jgi:V-type H+-transporting ATPase subunit D
LLPKPNMEQDNSSIFYSYSRGKVLESVKRATIKLEKSEENIAGVLIPALAVKEFEDSDNAMSQIGLERGGHSIQKCREKFRSILTLLVDIAGLQVLYK